VIRDDSYREIARALYEEYFGAWTGDDLEFDDLIAAMEVNPNIRICSEQAVTTCGEGHVCSVTVSGEDCSFVCQVGSQPCPSVEPN